MKQIFLQLTLLSIIGCFSSFAQIFPTNSTLPLNLSGTNGNGTCATNTRTLNVPVSGLTGPLSSTFNLQSINLTFNDCGLGTSRNYNLVIVRVMSPDGTCAVVMNGMGNGSKSGTIQIKYITAQSCMSTPNFGSTFQSATSNTSRGNFGVYEASNAGTGVDITSTFNGKTGSDINGDWKIIFNENSTSEPCVIAASLQFGDPTVTDLTAQGEGCLSAITYDGEAICASTSGKSPSSQMPGSTTAGGTNFTENIGGVSCAWNANNNNDIWIKYVATATETACISISGLSNALQSIVVRDANVDGDNDPCTGPRPTSSGIGTNDTRWILESCPRTSNSIYTTTAGTISNQNHCFNAMQGETYYLVVDGEGGAQSPFYITGSAGSSLLPVTLVSFNGYKKQNHNLLQWQTASEKNSDNFVIERSNNGIDFKEIGSVDAAGNTNTLTDYEYKDVSAKNTVNYYRLKQNDTDGKFSYSNMVRIYSKNTHVQISPNPVQNIANIELYNENYSDDKVSIEVVDLNGKIMKTHCLNMTRTTETISLPVEDLNNGFYILKTHIGNETLSVKMLKR